MYYDYLVSVPTGKGITHNIIKGVEYDFVIMVRGAKDIVTEIIKEKKGTFEELRENSI